MTASSTFSPSRPGRKALPEDQLSAREMTVLRWMSCGLENSEIAEQLVLSSETIKSHASAVFRKLGARNRAHAVSLGYRMGLLSLMEPEPTPRVIDTNMSS